LKANLDEIMGIETKPPSDYIEQAPKDKKVKGGNSSKKKNKSKYNNKRKTMKK